MAIFTGRTTPPDPQDLFLGADDVADVFRFTPATLEAADTVIGGGGAVIDILQFTAAGAIAAGSLNGVGGIERIQSHSGGNSYVLTQALVAGSFGTFEARGLAGADLIDASAVLNPALGISFISGGGADTLIGGAGADRFNALAASAGARALTGGGGNDVLTTSAALWSAADIFDGGAGVDRITFAEAGQVISAQLAGLSGVEEIQFFSNLSLALTVTDALVAQAGGLLTVIGGAGSGQRVDAGAVSLGRVHYLAGTGADTFIGTVGDDVFAVQEATSRGSLGEGDDILNLDNRKASGIVVDGGAGYDTAVLAAGGVWDLTGLSNFEELELAGTGTVLLPDQPGLRVLGSEQRDFVTLGAPGQTVFGFGADDMVLVTAATLVGAVLNGGSHASSDILRMTQPGIYDFRRAAIIGFERFETAAAPAAAGPSTIFLPNVPLDLLLRHAAQVTLGGNPLQTVGGSARADSFFLGATGQFLDGGAGNDLFTATAAQLGLGTVIVGGSGFDRLVIPGGGAADLAAGGLVLGVERIELQATTALTLDGTPGIEILGAAGADTVTGGALGLFGTLGNGDDELRLPETLLDPGSAAVMSGGGGNDLLTLLGVAGAPFALTVPTRFTDFERLDVSSIGTGSVTILGNTDWDVTIGAGPITVTGGDGDEYFRSASKANLVSAGAGNDTMHLTGGRDIFSTLAGGPGDDVIIHEVVSGSVSGPMPTGWVAETVRLLGNHTFAATTQAGLKVIGDPTIGNSITLQGSSQRAEGGAGADTLRASSGLQTALEGGNGADLYVTSVAEQVLWDTPGRTITDTAQAFVLNTLRIVGSGTLSIDFEEHSVTHIDRIEIMDAGVAARLTLTDALVSTADANNGGAAGDLHIEAVAGMTAGASIDGGNLTGANLLRFGGTFDGADTVTGGAGADSMQGASGNDSLIGNAGNDTIDGGAGADTIIPGAGSDGAVMGGTGGDRIDLAETVSATDRVLYTSAADGTADINDAASVSMNTADTVLSFNPAADKIRLDMSELGLGAGGVVAVAANGAWNIGTGAVFVFESDSANSDTLNSNSFADLNAIAFAINTDNGAGSGSSAGRTVALLISNPETQALRQTGLYVWTDTDGDSLLEAGDVVRLLAVFQGVTANQLVAGGSVELF